RHCRCVMRQQDSVFARSRFKDFRISFVEEPGICDHFLLMAVHPAGNRCHENRKVGTRTHSLADTMKEIRDTIISMRSSFEHYGILTSWTLSKCFIRSWEAPFPSFAWRDILLSANSHSVS